MRSYSPSRGEMAVTSCGDPSVWVGGLLMFYVCEWEVIICGFVSLAGMNYRRGDMMPKAEVLVLDAGGRGARTPSPDASSSRGPCRVQTVSPPTSNLAAHVKPFDAGFQ